MSNSVLTTPVDSLVKIVRENQPCSISLIVSKLRLPLDLIEKWLIILEEYQVLTISYKGLDGFVKITEQEFSQDELSADNIKESFIQKCVKKKISYSKMSKIWPVFILRFERELKELFLQEAKKSGHSINKSQAAWIKFKTELERF